MILRFVLLTSICAFIWSGLFSSSSIGVTLSGQDGSSPSQVRTPPSLQAAFSLHLAHAMNYVAYAPPGVLHSKSEASGAEQTDLPSASPDKDISVTPVPEYKLPLVVNGDKMSWFDDNTLAFSSIPQGKIGLSHEDVYFWHYEDKTISLAASSADIWCAHEGNFVYEKSLSEKDGTFTLDMIQTGSAGTKEFSVPIVKTKVFTSLPFLYTSPDHNGYNPNFYKSSEKFNPFDCSWTSSRKLADLYPEYDWEYLRPGDGIIAFNGSLTEIEGYPTKVLHYRDVDGIPTTLPIPPAVTETLKIRSVNYYPFHGAYFIAVPEIVGINADETRCQKAWWFTAENDEVSEVCLPFDFLAKQREISVAPSAKGMLRFLPVFESKRHPGGSDGGVYLTDDKGRTTKIWQGIATSGVVSPNGCLVAVNTSSPVILDLCH